MLKYEQHKQRNITYETDDQWSPLPHLNLVGDGASTSRRGIYAIKNHFESSHPVSLRLPPFSQKRAIYYIFLWIRGVEDVAPYNVQYCLCRPIPLRRLTAPPVSLRLGHARVLTTHCVVIHYAHAASLPTGEG